MELGAHHGLQIRKSTVLNSLLPLITHTLIHSVMHQMLIEQLLYTRPYAVLILALMGFTVK